VGEGHFFKETRRIPYF